MRRRSTACRLELDVKTGSHEDITIPARRVQANKPARHQGSAIGAPHAKSIRRVNVYYFFALFLTYRIEYERGLHGDSKDG
jgi:hypothetical protein